MEDRLEKLNHTAKRQLEVMINDKNIIEINKYNDEIKMIEDKNK